MTAAKRLSAVLMIFVFFGCAGGVKYGTLEGYLKADNCIRAAEYVEKKEKGYGPNRKLLFLLDAAMVNMLCGKYEKSNEYFHDAEDVGEELWTKSVTKEAAAFLVSDYTIPYSGEDFERALINLFSAINYAMLEQYDEALVECRRLDANLSMINQKYETKNVYKEDAFGRYLSGILYESVGNLDDAFIDYYKAFRVFQDYKKDYGTRMPSILLEDLMRIAEKVGRTEEVRSSVRKFGNIRGLSFEDAKRSGKIVFVHFNGKSPVKVEDRLHIPLKHGPVTLAFPRYEIRMPPCRDITLLVEAGSVSRTVKAEIVEDINGIALKNLDDRKGRVVAKTIARAAIKQAAINAAAERLDSKVEREAVKVVLNILNMAIERADKRSWRTLPGEIYLTRVFVPEGRYNIFVRPCKGEKTFVDAINVKAGETGFVLYETMY